MNLNELGSEQIHCSVDVEEMLARVGTMPPATIAHTLSLAVLSLAAYAYAHDIDLDYGTEHLVRLHRKGVLRCKVTGSSLLK